MTAFLNLLMSSRSFHRCLENLLTLSFELNDPRDNYVDDVASSLQRLYILVRKSKKKKERKKNNKKEVLTFVQKDEGMDYAKKVLGDVIEQVISSNDNLLEVSLDLETEKYRTTKLEGGKEEETKKTEKN